MPANFPIETIYLQGGTYAGFNSATLFKPGELGSRSISAAGHQWQLVQCDSGATASTAIGAVAAGQLAYWKALEGSYIVTNDIKQALGQGTTNNGFRNFVAGLFTTAVTAGNYCMVQQGGPSEVAVNIASGSTPAIGDTLVSDTTAATAQVASVNAGTAPTCLVVGVATAAKVSNAVQADLQIPGIP